MAASRDRIVDRRAFLGIGAVAVLAGTTRLPAAIGGFTGLAFVGCFTEPKRGGRGKGISVYRVSRPWGPWELVHVAEPEWNPAFLAMDREGKFLYSVHGGETEAVSAHRIDARAGTLTRLNEEASGGFNPNFLAIDASGRWLVVANYIGGSVAVLPIRADGSLGPRAELVAMEGKPGPHRTEQATAHPHQCAFDRSGRFVVVPDKGFDRVNVFRFDATTGKMTPATPGFVSSRAGAGPRHVDFHPTRPFAYVLNELDNSVTTYRVDAESGAFTPLQVLTSLPSSFVGDDTAGEIAVTVNGRFVLASNRGHDSLAVFAVDPQTCLLTHGGWQPTQGRIPRFFAFEPGGTGCYVANQGSDTIVEFSFDAEAGTLRPTGLVVPTPSPSAIVFRAG